MHYNIPIGQKSHDHLDRFIKGHQQSSISVLNRIPEKIRDRKKTTQDNKCYLWQIHSQYFTTGVKAKCISSKIQSETGCQLSLLLFNTLLQVSTRTIAPDKETGLGKGMREGKWSRFIDDALYSRVFKGSSRTRVELINTCGNVAAHKSCSFPADS